MENEEGLGVVQEFIKAGVAGTCILGTTTTHSGPQSQVSLVTSTLKHTHTQTLADHHHYYIHFIWCLLYFILKGMILSGKHPCGWTNSHQHDSGGGCQDVGGDELPIGEAADPA